MKTVISTKSSEQILASRAACCEDGRFRLQAVKDGPPRWPCDQGIAGQVRPPSAARTSAHAEKEDGRRNRSRCPGTVGMAMPAAALKGQEHTGKACLS